MAQFHDHIASLFQVLYQARSVRTIEKEGGRRAGAGKEKGEALSFTRPYPFSSPVLLVFRRSSTDREPGTG